MIRNNQLKATQNDFKEWLVEKRDLHNFKIVGVRNWMQTGARIPVAKPPSTPEEWESETKRVTLNGQKAEIEKKLVRYYGLIENDALDLNDIAARIRELNAEKEAVAAGIAQINAQAPRPVAFAKPTEEIVAAYVEDLRDTLNEGSIMQRKAFLNSFIRRINIKDSKAEIEYTCPIGLGGNRRNEVLSMAQIGSRGRARTYNFAVNSRALYH